MESSDESFERPEDHNQLSKAIQNYQQALDKCKKVIKLGNYHKYYKKYLDKRCDKLKASQLCKIQVLVPPGVGTDHNFNIFKFISSKLHKAKISFPVIDTLILSSQVQFFLRNNVEGDLVSTEGDLSVSEFFKRLRMSTPGLPVCIAKPDKGKLLLFDSIGNLSIYLQQNPFFEGSIQKFILSQTDHLNIVRVHWQSTGKVRGFLIRKKETLVAQDSSLKRISLMKSRNNVLASTETSDDGKPGQTDEECLNYAFGVVKKHKRSQLRRISFLNDNNTQGEIPQKELFSIYENENHSHLNSIRSFLEQVESKCKEQKVSPWNGDDSEPLFFSDKEAEKFLVLGSDPEHLEVTELKTVYEPIFLTLEKIIDKLDRHLIQHKKTLKEISIDFIKDSKSWLLLKVDDVKINESLQNFKEVPAPFNKLTFSSFVPPLKNQYGKKIDMLCVKIRNIPSKRPDPPLLHKRTMTITYPIIPVRYPSIKEKCRGSISKLRERFDSFIKKTEDIQFKDNFKLDQQKQTLISSYAESFEFYAKNLKELESKKSMNASDINSSLHKGKEANIKSKSVFNLKPVMKEYNSMMIHVRRVNLRNKKPLIDSYGGEEFFRNIIKTFCQRVVPLETINKRVSAMSRDAFHGMFLKGLGCIFNSILSLEFRQLVRQRHKNLGIDPDTYKNFCSIFLVVLQEFKISALDLEVINDNLLSFSGAICSQLKLTQKQGKLHDL